jgi:hypothetical protein
MEDDGGGLLLTPVQPAIKAAVRKVNGSAACLLFLHKRLSVTSKVFHST